ncbi:MAG: PDP protein [Sulfurospirillum sp.]|nr:PDP protein [Sulfurospirillum sp.]MBL0703275.1 PDP protein [Sulfurospirillum sp.]
MRILIVVFMFIATVFAQTIDCTQIFEERKLELLKEIEKIDEARQSFEALQGATNALFDKKQAKIDSQTNDLNITMSEIKIQEEDIKKMIEENSMLLETISDIKNNKISETYSKMKDSAAAAIFEEMSVDESAAVIFTLEAKKVSKIMAKMEPEKASKITQRLVLGPPFE